MLVVMPVCSVDLALARDLADWILHLGGVKSYPALLVWSPEVSKEDRDYILERFQKAFLLVRQMEPQLGYEYVGWPAAPNRTFEVVIKYCFETEPRFANGGPIYFMEADNMPLKSGWLDELAAEYIKLNKPFMGVLENSWEILPDGTKRVAGQHLVGTAVYGAALPHVTNAFRELHFPAFDVAMQNDLVASGLSAHTNVIQHNWLTENYRREGDAIVCDRREGRLSGQIGYSLNRKIVPNTCMIVHGCKDGSLLKLLKEEPARKRGVPMKRKRVTKQ